MFMQLVFRGFISTCEERRWWWWGGVTVPHTNGRWNDRETTDDARDYKRFSQECRACVKRSFQAFQTACLVGRKLRSGAGQQSDYPPPLTPHVICRSRMKGAFYRRNSSEGSRQQPAHCVSTFLTLHLLPGPAAAERTPTGSAWICRYDSQVLLWILELHRFRIVGD